MRGTQGTAAHSTALWARGGGGNAGVPSAPPRVRVPFCAQESTDRHTPQAFSHWTHEFSRGRYIIVDIQGVNDTYSDPQVLRMGGGGAGGRAGAVAGGSRTGGVGPAKAEGVGRCGRTAADK